MNILQYLSIIGAASFKFMFGPITGAAMGLHWYESLLCSIIGMLGMVGVMMGVFKGVKESRKLVRPNAVRKSPFNRRNRWAVWVRQRLGLWGIALLTPVVFTPPVGAMLALAFRYPKKEILFKMFVSATLWGIFFVFFAYYLRGVLF